VADNLKHVQIPTTFGTSRHFLEQSVSLAITLVQNIKDLMNQKKFKNATTIQGSTRRENTPVCLTEESPTAETLSSHSTVNRIRCYHKTHSKSTIGGFTPKLGWPKLHEFNNTYIQH
jgi:hypothetical protein